MRWSLIGVWLVFSLMIYIFYVVSNVNLSLMVKRVEYTQGYHSVELDIVLVNNGQNFLSPKTQLIVLGKRVTLNHVLGPGDSLELKIIVPLNSSTEKIVLDKNSIKVEESVDIYSSLWYFIQHLPQELVSSFH